MYLLDENNGDICYEVVGKTLILKIRPDVISALKTPIVINENKGSESYWKLTETGLSIYTEYPAFSKGDIVAFAENTEISNIPIATLSSLGIVGIKDGGGISIENGYIFLTDTSSGTEPTKISILTSTDTNTAASDDNVFSALRALAEIQKTVNSQYWTQIEDYIFTAYEARSQKDFIAYATSNATSCIPIASATSIGIVGIRSGGGLAIDENGFISISSDYKGGTAFTVGKALQLTSDNVLNVLFGTTSATACAGNDNRLSDKRACPYALKFSGYSAQSYDGSSDVTVPIPTKVTDLSDNTNYATKGYVNSTLLDYVTLDTVQAVTGAKTFTSSLIDTADVVAYSSGSYTSSIPIATSSTYGLIKYDDSTILKNSNGQLYAATQSVDLSNYVDITNSQVITGEKTFSKGIKINSIAPLLYLYNSNYSTRWELCHYSSLQLYYNGNLRGSFSNSDGTYSSSSDERLKNISGRETSILDKIRRIVPIYYTMKDDESKKARLGLSAQEVKESFEEFVTKVNGYYSLNYAQLGAVIAIGGCNELNHKINDLQNKINDLQNRLKSLPA